MSAYNKWAYIFDNDLPCSITTKQSALTVVTYIRDVIEFAYLNNLKGQHWYKTVSVIATGTNTLDIKQKKHLSRNSARIMANTYITRSVFDLISLQQDMKLPIGTKFFSSEDFEDLDTTMRSLGVTLRLCIEETEEGICEVIDNSYETVTSNLPSDPNSISDNISSMLKEDDS